MYEDVTLNLEGTAHIDTVTFDLDEGWNLLGDPLLWGMPLDSTLFRVGETTYSLEEAIDEELVLPILYNWLAADNGYTEETSFNPWLGVWFMSLAEDMQMLVYPVVQEEENRDAQDEQDEVSVNQWRLTIAASVENASDLTTALGVEPDATDGFDIRYDFPEPPAPPGGKYIMAYFHHNDWDRRLGRNFNKDVRSYLDFEEEAEWELTVETSDDEEVTMTWQEIAETIPEDYVVIMEDPQADRTINLLDENSYSYQSTGERELIIRVTSLNSVRFDPYQGIPSDFAIVSVHPNPFNATTTIVYGLPTSTDVSLTVYDVSGRRVAALISGYQSVGYHSVVFNGEGQAAGVYVVKLDANGVSESRKITLVK